LRETENFDKEIYSGYCDKCGELVQKNNCLLTLYEQFEEVNPWSVGPPRHFLPTEKCGGSPSRAQYIEGQPKDNRGYKYDPKMEPVYRKAFQKLQEKYNELL
jgi:hypothetical protein